MPSSHSHARKHAGRHERHQAEGSRHPEFRNDNEPRDRWTPSRQSGRSGLLPMQSFFGLMPTPMREFLLAPWSVWPMYSGQGMTRLFDMHRDMMRVADQMLCNLYNMQEGAQALLSGQAAQSHSACETREDRYVFTLEVPEELTRALKVLIMPGTLTVSATQERSQREEGGARRMQQARFFERVFPLAWDANIENVQAEIEEAALTVTVPRRPVEAAVPHEVKIERPRHQKKEAA